MLKFNLIRQCLCLLLITIASNVYAEDFVITTQTMRVSATGYGNGEHVVIALHGSDGNRSQFGDYASAFTSKGLRLVAIDWPASSGGGFGELDAAVTHARETGAKKISLMGYSRGGALVMSYARMQPDGEFNTLVSLSSADDLPVLLTKTKKLFVANKYDASGRWSLVSAEKSAEPKRVFALGSGGHHISALIAEKKDLMQEIVAEIMRD